MTTSQERRRNQRPWPPAPGLMERLDAVLAGAASSIRHHWTGRIVFTLVILASLGVLAWSLQQRLPLLKGSRAHLLRLHDLQMDIEELRQQIKQGRDIEDDLGRLENRIMPDLETATTWMNKLSAELESAGARIKWRIVNARPIPGLDDLRGLVVSIAIQSDPGEYAAIMQTIRRHVEGAWLAEMIGLDAQGRENDGVSTLTVKLRLWLRDQPAVEEFAMNTDEEQSQ